MRSMVDDCYAFAGEMELYGETAEADRFEAVASDLKRIVDERFEDLSSGR
jgi:hypothetical protein